MKSNRSKIGLLVAAALMGMSHAASANTEQGEDFTPLERLAPEERALFEKRIQVLERAVRIDWKTVIIGVNTNGELTLRDRKSVDVQDISQPSCWPTRDQ